MADRSIRRTSQHCAESGFIRRDCRLHRLFVDGAVAPVISAERLKLLISAPGSVEVAVLKGQPEILREVCLFRA